jgi:DNA-binding response OmpR family regulator
MVFLQAEPRGKRGELVDFEARIWAADRPRDSESPSAVRIPALIVSPFEEDHATLRQMLAPPGFGLRSARSFREAAPLIEEFPIIIAECNLGGCCWKDLWNAIQVSPKRPWPRLIVAADIANDRLWAEVINLGAQDVLAKPFDSAEVHWVVAEAWASWNRERGVRTESTPAARSAAQHG